MGNYPLDFFLLSFDETLKSNLLLLLSCNAYDIYVMHLYSFTRLLVQCFYKESWTPHLYGSIARNIVLTAITSIVLQGNRLMDNVHLFQEPGQSW